MIARPPSRPDAKSFVLGFSRVHVGKSLLWAGEDSLILYVMIRFLALSPALAGAIFLASSLWNALCDGAIGTLMHRRSRPARWLPAVTWGAILAASLGFAMLPLLPAHAPWTVAGVLLLIRTGYALVDVPHNGLTRSLARDGQHLRAAQIRAGGSAGAALIVGAACAALLWSSSPGRTTAALLVGSIAGVALLLMTSLPRLLATEPPEREASGAKQSESTMSTALWHYCGATMLGLAGLGAMGKALLHLRGPGTGVIETGIMLVIVARLASIGIWSSIARRMGSRLALAFAYLVCAIAALAFPLAAQTGGMALLMALGLFGLAGGGVTMVGWAVLSEVLDTGVSTERGTAYTAAFGLFTMSMKIALGLSGALVGGWLALSGTSINVPPEEFQFLCRSVACMTLAAAAWIAHPALGHPRHRIRRRSLPKLP